ncbi:hypothetical protein [Paracoccus sp. (in: a-proteobacteria)]|uniref:hypothetical protein n=1 Tax=Paracoccus sp. TaxID=267 RepID=UPI002AFED566|nr:hypothetical protein [Paracoccus sp. (in: a-proteobacteria)]
MAGATIITYAPAGPGPGALLRQVWQTSQAMLEAGRQGNAHAASFLARWLGDLRQDPRITPPLARTMDRAILLSAARLTGLEASMPCGGQILPLSHPTPAQMPATGAPLPPAA